MSNSNEMIFAIWLIVILLLGIVWGSTWAISIHYHRHVQAQHANRKKL